MNGLERETLGQIWRLCEQMSYAAQSGYTDTLKAQFICLQKQMVRLDMIQEQIG